MGGNACNGWRFWSLEGDLKPKTAKPEKAPKAELVIKPMKGAEGRFFCSACQDAFASSEDNPTCAKGHSNAQSEEPPTEVAKPPKKASSKPAKKAPAKRKTAAKAKA